MFVLSNALYPGQMVGYGSRVLGQLLAHSPVLLPESPEFRNHVAATGSG